jgi:hypothetical protein
MPGLGLGLAAVTCEVMGGGYVSVPLADSFWDLAHEPNIGWTGTWALIPLEIGATSLFNGTAVDDLPDNLSWDLIDISDGAGAVHYTPEDTSSIASGTPKHYWLWIVGRADGGDAADTSYLRPTGFTCSIADSNC